MTRRIVTRREKRKAKRAAAWCIAHNVRRGVIGWIFDYRPMNRRDRKRAALNP